MPKLSAARPRVQPRPVLLEVNVGYEFVHLEASNALIGLELQARGTAAPVDGYQVATAAVLVGGTVMP